MSANFMKKDSPNTFLFFGCWNNINCDNTLTANSGTITATGGAGHAGGGGIAAGGAGGDGLAFVLANTEFV